MFKGININIGFISAQQIFKCIIIIIIIIIISVRIIITVNYLLIHVATCIGRFKVTVQRDNVSVHLFHLQDTVVDVVCVM